jgi:hypothetical protein
MNTICTRILEETSQGLNMSRQQLKADMKRLAEYWEIVLQNGKVDNVNTAILFLDASIHGYLKAKGIDLGKKKISKKEHEILTGIILLVPIYVWEQPPECFPKIHQLTPLAEEELARVLKGGDVLAQAEKILREMSEDNSPG